MAKIQYHKIGDASYGLVLYPDKSAVALYDKTRSYGAYYIDKFGPEPLTPKGNLKVSAIRYFFDWVVNSK